MGITGLKQGDQAYDMDQLQIGPEVNFPADFRQEASSPTEVCSHGLREVRRIGSRLSLDEINCVAMAVSSSGGGAGL